jgi:hypothetical protein
MFADRFDQVAMFNEAMSNRDPTAFRADIEVRFVDFRQIGDHRRPLWTEFALQVSYQGSSRTVSRRFKDFEELHNALSVKRNAPGVELPAKQWFGRFKADFIERRMQQLQRYMDALLAVERLCSHRTMSTFLDLAPAIAQPLPGGDGGGGGMGNGGSGGGAASSVDKFCAPFIEMGLPAEAAHGLEDLMGVGNADKARFFQDPRRAIASEFERHGSAKDKFNFERIATGQSCEKCPGKTVELLAQHPHAKTARLEEYHVLALRLYTSSSYSQINNPLRAKQRPHPFAATTYFVSEAIKKLRAVAAQQEDAHKPKTLWRGMRNLQLSDRFAAEGGTDFACTSTSASSAVARKFADSDCPLVFKFVTQNFMSRGADISWLSVFPDEAEALYPPLTYLRAVSTGRESVGGKMMRVTTVEPMFPS